MKYTPTGRQSSDSLHTAGVQVLLNANSGQRKGGRTCKLSDGIFPRLQDIPMNYQWRVK
jgi:hypothetical protein